MMFLLTALSARGGIRNFTYVPTHLEEGFDFLNTVVTMGDTLLNVRLMDGDTETELPLDVFDGTAFREPMQELENEWQTLLSEPARSAVTFDKTWLIDLNRQRIGLCDASIHSQQTMIHRLFKLIEQNEAKGAASLNRAAFTQRYQAQLTTYQAQVQKLKLQRGRIARRINALTYL